ncbi:hypothetical protein COO60DRAFT_1460570 [Scenedesmus sp. NREL 46B-D3]|nr:hypothetical protein COO60DRAFT_1460570 [Scenedesmus sp. NREL 46B-D3]
MICGYVAEKVTILLGALRSALRRVGLVVQTVDDSLVPLEDKLKGPAVQEAQCGTCRVLIRTVFIQTVLQSAPAQAALNITEHNNVAAHSPSFKAAATASRVLNQSALLLICIICTMLQDAFAQPHSPGKALGLHSIGLKVEQALQDAAEYKDSHAAQVAHDAMQDDRLHRAGDRDRRIELPGGYTTACHGERCGASAAVFCCTLSIGTLLHANAALMQLIA